MKSESRFRERFSMTEIMNQEKLSLKEILSMIDVVAAVCSGHRDERTWFDNATERVLYLAAMQATTRGCGTIP